MKLCKQTISQNLSHAVPQLIYGGKLDFLVFDYLSEITMSLLSAAKTKAPVSYLYLM